MGNCNNDKSNLEPEIIGIPEACRSYLKNTKLRKLLKHGKLFDNSDESNLEPIIIGIPEACRTDLKNVKLRELLKHGKLFDNMMSQT